MVQDVVERRPCADQTTLCNDEAMWDRSLSLIELELDPAARCVATPSASGGKGPARALRDPAWSLSDYFEATTRQKGALDSRNRLHREKLHSAPVGVHPHQQRVVRERIPGERETVRATSHHGQGRDGVRWAAAHQPHQDRQGCARHVQAVHAGVRGRQQCSQWMGCRWVREALLDGRGEEGKGRGREQDAEDCRFMEEKLQQGTG